jgi:predicted RecA/RadA family phage recombinase
MARTFKQPGDILYFVAPTGGVVSGEPLMIGSLFVIPQVTAAEDETFAGAVEETHELAKTSAQAWAAGDPIHWDIANEQADNTPVGPRIGSAAAAAANPSDTGEVKLDGIAALEGEVVFAVRKRFTIAQVNAGATILPARPGRKYRMVGCKAISVGGAAGDVTTVDVLGTQAAAAAKLVAYAQASLTQNTVLRDGATGGDVLAGGASYVANDVNTPITIGKTGASVTTATHIDVVLQYSVDV